MTNISKIKNRIVRDGGLPKWRGIKMKILLHRGCGGGGGAGLKKKPRPGKFSIIREKVPELKDDNFNGRLLLLCPLCNIFVKSLCVIFISLQFYDIFCRCFAVMFLFDCLASI